MGTMTYSLWYKGKSYDSGSYRVLACNAIDPPDEIPDDPAGTIWCRTIFSASDIRVGAVWPDATHYAWIDQTAVDNNGLTVVNGIMQFEKTISSGGILRILQDSRSKIRRIKVKPSADCTLDINNDGTSFFKTAIGGQWNIIDVHLDGTGTTFTDVERWPVGINYLAFDYIGTGAFTSEKHLSVATKAHLCIHPTTKQLGFFQNSIFTPFSTDAIIEDDKKYHICLMMNNGLATLRLNGKLMVTDLPMFSEDTYPITKWGNYYPSEMSFKRGLAPSTTLKPSSTLAPSNTILSNTTHANGWIDEIRIYDRILSADDVEGIIYHTLLQE